MCGCKKGKKGRTRKGRQLVTQNKKNKKKRRKNLFHKSEGQFIWSQRAPVRKPRKPKERKQIHKCIKHRLTSGVYFKNNTTKRKKHRQKIIGARRGKKRGAQWIDDDYLANMPTIGGIFSGKYKKGQQSKYAFLK